MVTGLIFYYWKVTNVLGKVSPILLDYTGCVFSDVCPFKAGSKYSQLVFLLAELLSKFKLSSLTVRATTKRKYQWICAGDGLRPDRCLLSNSWHYGFRMPEASSPSDETLYDEVTCKVKSYFSWLHSRCSTQFSKARSGTEMALVFESYINAVTWIVIACRSRVVYRKVK